MNCQEVMELMQRHVDNDLDDEETSRMTDHVGHCPECAAMLEKLLVLSKGLEQLPRVVPPYSLVDAILPELGKLDAAGAEMKGYSDISPRSRRVERKRRTWIGRVSGVVALGVVVGLLLINGPGLPFSGSSEKDASSEAPQAEIKMFNKSSEKYEETGDVANQFSVQATSSDDTDTMVRKENEGAVPSSAPSPDGASGGGGVSGSEGAASGGSSGGSGSGVVTEPAAGAPDNPAPSVPGEEAAVPGFTEGDKNKGLIDSPTETPSAGMMGGAPAPAPAVETLSPDGKWKAVLTNGALELYRTSDNSLVFEPAPDGGTRSDLIWSKDSQSLNYTYTDAQGNATSLTLLLPDLIEKAR